MKKIFLLCLVLGLRATGAAACSICGCSLGNYFVGPFPQFDRPFAGVRYTFRSFETVLADNPNEFSHDFYQTTELWGGANFGKRWQTFAFVPYNRNRQKDDDGLYHASGIGDVTLLLNYNLVRSRGESVRHLLWVGAGLKLPTGRYAPEPGEEIVSSANSQPGTGSLDFVLNGLYAVRFGPKWGVNMNVSYKLNQAAQGFRFGDRLASGAYLIHSIRGTGVVLSPNAGVLFESQAANRLDGGAIADTGGRALLGTLGLEATFSHVAFGANVQLPVAENLSNGQTENRVRGMLHVTYTF